MTRADLIAALEAAAGPSRELDALVWLYVRPEEWQGMINHVSGPPESYAPRYSFSIDVALTLVPDVLGTMWDVAKYPGEQAAAYVGQHGNPCREFVIAKTPALALCIAALKAGEGKDG